MSMTSNRVRGALTTVAAVVGLVSCGPIGGGEFVGGKMTGGGWIPSSSQIQGHKANFGFNAAQCVEGQIAGHFNFHDKHAPAFPLGGVKVSGSVVAAKLCTAADPCSESDCPIGAFEVEVTYRSTNPRYPGPAGRALACVEDKGEGANATGADNGKIVITTGVFRGYENQGPVQGNIQAHECTCTDGKDNDGDGLVDAADPACLDANDDEE
jgi:hypothetical protein